MRKCSWEPSTRIEVLEYFKAPNKVRQELDIYWLDVSKNYRKCFIFFDGETKWSNLESYPNVSKTRKEKVQPSLNSWFWLLQLKRKQLQMFFLNKEKKKEKTIYKIKCKFGKNWIILFIDGNLYFPVKRIYYIENFDTGEMFYEIRSEEREEVYENFEKINGVFIPFKTKSISKFWRIGAHKALLEEIEKVISELKIGNDIKFDDDFFNLEKLATPRINRE